MSLTFFWRCEGTTLDGTDDFTAGDNTATVQGTVSISTTAANIGTNGVLVGAGNSHYRFDPTSISNRLTGAVGLWVRVTTAASAIASIVMLRGNSANDYYMMECNGTWGASTGELRFSSRSTDTGGAPVTVTTSGATLTVDTWYFCVIKWDQGASLRRVEVYNSSGTLIQGVTNSDAYVAPLDLAIAAGVRLGEATGNAIVNHLDNIFIGDAYADGPLFLTNRNITSYTAYDDGVGGSNANLLVGKFGALLRGKL